MCRHVSSLLPASHGMNHVREEPFLGEEHSEGSLCVVFVRPRRVTLKSWLLLGRIWEGQGLRRLGRNLRPCFFPVQPFLVDRAVRESHERLAAAPLYVFPAFVIELFLSISGFFTHATWGFVCSSTLMVGEVESTALSLFLLAMTGQDVSRGHGLLGLAGPTQKTAVRQLYILYWGMGYIEAPNLENLGHISCHPVPLPSYSSVINYRVCYPALHRF